MTAEEEKKTKQNFLLNKGRDSVFLTCIYKCYMSQKQWSIKDGNTMVLSASNIHITICLGFGQQYTIIIISDVDVKKNSKIKLTSPREGKQSFMYLKTLLSTIIIVLCLHLHYYSNYIYIYNLTPNNDIIQHHMYLI